MKTSILALCLAFLCRAQAAPTPEAAMDYVPAHGNLNSGFADPLTLAMRVEESRRQKYGNMNSSDAQSKIAFTQLNTVPLGGCGSHCRSTLSFSGKGEPTSVEKDFEKSLERRVQDHALQENNPQVELIVSPWSC